MVAKLHPTEFDLIESFQHGPRKFQDLVIETAVEMFQETRSEEDFQIVVDLYEPLSKRRTSMWRSRYGHLCDSEADFRAEFMEAFTRACLNFKSGDKRRAEGKIVRGDGSLNTLAWSVISLTFRNKISFLTRQFRNPEVRCPICEKMISPLSKHLLDVHCGDLMEQSTTEMLEKGDGKLRCPWCPRHTKENLRWFDEPSLFYRHVVAKHSSTLFTRFNDLYPGHNTGIHDPAPPIGCMGPDGDSISAHEMMDTRDVKPIGGEQVPRDEKLETLLCGGGLTECQRTILFLFLYEDENRIPSADALCGLCHHMRNTAGCPRGEGFRLERESLEAEKAELGAMILASE
jgi:hypothetical protein